MLTPEKLLERSDQTAQILAHARLLMRLERRFAAAVPPGLAEHARVVNYRSGVIVIHAENGAVAAKIRQMSQRLCADLSTGSLACSALEVRVKPPQPLPAGPGATVKPLSGATLATLRETAEHLPQGPLREALDRLMERSAKKD